MKPFAKIKDLFSSKDMKRSKKRDSMLKALDKLEKHGKKLRHSLKDDISRKKRKHLEAKLETNKKHQKKARKYIEELD